MSERGWNFYLYIAVLVFGIVLACYAILLTSYADDNQSHGSHHPKFIYREEWGGRLPRRVERLCGPISLVVIRDTKRLFCVENSDCNDETLEIQSDNMSKNLSDIAYNFLIGGDGNIYVGRGWDVRSAYSNQTLDIAFHGNYKFDSPFPDMLRAAELLIQQGVMMHYLKMNYILVCQNQTNTSGREARHLCGEVRKWKHYDNRTHFDIVS